MGLRKTWMVLVCGVALLALLLLPTPGLAVAGRAIVISRPSAYQVVQRNAAGRATIVVAGLRRGLRGPVQVRWRAGDWLTVRCSENGFFRAHLRSCPAGQGKLVVRSAVDHRVRSSRLFVGVGDVYVIAGQSNASGRARRMATWSSTRFRPGLLGNDDRWRMLRDPVDGVREQVDAVSRDTHVGGSVWPLVATELMADDGIPVAFIPCARGATTIERWLPVPAHRLSRRTLYGSMIRRVRLAGGSIRAVLFWQGEADARADTPGGVYTASLQRLARALAKDAGAPLIAAQIGDYDPGPWQQPAVDTIRLAQEDAWSAGDGVLAGPVLYDIDLGEKVHFIDPHDVGVAAHRWAQAILADLSGDVFASPPKLASADYDGDVTVLLHFDCGAAALSPGTVGGLVVRAGGVRQPITSAAVTAADVVTVQLAQPAQAPLTVTLGSGRESIGQPVPKTTSPWLLPALPFVDQPVATVLR